MKIIRKTYYFLLSPFILVAAIVLFVLDNFNVNVNPITAYISKEAPRS